ncbi:hypothetical protein AQUCO_13300007v1 [Aquilegia coerulea]|uniref:Pentacotripeptide-repeat region of PRORP domain-containing protein n=1 Tax=Aquilegia coerulea TaxID=218851 RepID=A0A2G5C154_AQUCA|nr:hypothetical protein AQUCO_13300007v1 [Aquilegia coerulea]
MFFSATFMPFSSISSNFQSQSNENMLFSLRRKKRGIGVIRMSSSSNSNRSKNRKPLQKGRNLSIEAIQTVQALKRANNNNKDNKEMLERVFESKVRRLLKLDMIAILKELLRQNEPLLALKVFEDVRKEYWYKPQLLLYSDMIQMLVSNNLLEKVDLIVFYLKIEMLRLDADINTERFNVLLQRLMDYGFTTHAMECFQLMKKVECDLNEETFRILVIGLESKGEMDLSSMVRQEAQKYMGWPLDCLEEKEEINLS